MQAKVDAKITTPQQIAKFIDHTLLKNDTTEEQVTKLCEEALQNKFAAVCIYPRFVSLASSLLANSEVMTVAVVGFPTGLNTSGEKVAEATAALESGADEIDMVINIAALKNKDYQAVFSDIRAVADACRRAPLKVILETSQLKREEKIAACALAVAAGASFVKTSTGVAGGATLEDVLLMRETVGPKIGVKASGGIRDFETAKAMIEAGASRLGTSSGVQIVRGQKSQKEY